MTSKKIRGIGAAVLVAVWVALTAFAWFTPAKAESEAERRELEQMPALNADTLLDGSFMKDFEDYTLDQFPLRDSFRSLKAIFHNYVLQQMDNNNIYIADGYAAEMEYPLDTDSVAHAMKTVASFYESYIKDKGCNVYLTVVPDKSYYLAQPSGHLSMDYEAMFSMVKESLPEATYIDITDTLSIGDYYYTDTHWRQEKILDVAKRLAEAMGTQIPEDYTQNTVETPFYGVYAGQSALVCQPDTIVCLTNDVIADFVVEGAQGVYDMTKVDSRDPYELFLSGNQPVVKVTNPHNMQGKRLILFRDSFGSSIAPLLAQGYSEVVLVDLRYINSQLLDQYVDFENADVLFLYSTLLLNNSLGMK